MSASAQARVVSTSGAPPLVGRGRPRDTAASRRIVAAARQLLAERGFAGVTVNAIASRAKTGLDTVYRRWPSKELLLGDAIAAAVAEEVAVPDTGQLRDDLIAILTSLVTSCTRTDLGKLLMMAMAESISDEVLAEQVAAAQVQRRQQTRPIVERAIERRELPVGADPDLVFDMLNGIVFQRLFMAHRPISMQEVPGLVDALIAGAIAHASTRAFRREK
jgi:AcrR family transcriptional regulator